MGTRGLLGFITLGQRHSAHNYYYSYSKGLGKDIVDFILSLTPEDFSTMARLVAEITWVEWLWNGVRSPAPNCRSAPFTRNIL